MDIVSALRSFLRVAEAGSFSAAAGDLQLTQPAVSRQISALEARFETRLLHRTTSGLSLTAEGQRVIPIATRILEAVDEIGDTLGASERGPSGRVRISVPAPFGLKLSGMLTDLLQRNSQLDVEVTFRESASDMVEDGLDLEVRLGAVADSSLMSRRIGWTTAFLVAAPAYLARRPAPKTPDEIATHDCISYSRAGNGRIWEFSDGSDKVSVRIRPRLIADNAVAIHRAALSGAGLAILSHIIVAGDVAAGRLVSVMPEYPPMRLPIHVVYPSRHNVPLRVKIVLEHLIALVRDDPEMAS